MRELHVDPLDLAPMSELMAFAGTGFGGVVA
jgi:hypothetical protein